MGYLATDGTKIKANASNDYTLSEDELKEIRRIVERGIEIDEEEDKLYGDKRGDELPPELNTQEKLRKKIKELEEASVRLLRSELWRMPVQVRMRGRGEKAGDYQ